MKHKHFILDPKFKLNGFSNNIADDLHNQFKKQFPDKHEWIVRYIKKGWKLLLQTEFYDDDLGWPAARDKLIIKFESAREALLYKLIWYGNEFLND